MCFFLDSYHIQSGQWLLWMQCNGTYEFGKMLRKARDGLRLVQRRAVFQTAQNTFWLLYGIQGQIKFGRMIVRRIRLEGQPFQLELLLLKCFQLKHCVKQRSPARIPRYIQLFNQLFKRIFLVLIRTERMLFDLLQVVQERFITRRIIANRQCVQEYAY
ncbi:hypothetical protein D1872_159510 [compost metagenome]